MKNFKQKLKEQTSNTKNKTILKKIEYEKPNYSIIFLISASSLFIIDEISSIV